MSADTPIDVAAVAAQLPALAAVGPALARAGFTPDKVLTYVGAAALSDLSRAVDDARRRAAAREASRRGPAAVIELIACGIAQPAAAIEHAIGAPALAALEAVGLLARAGDLLEARACITPAQRRIGPRGGYPVGPVIYACHDPHHQRFEPLAVMPPDISSEMTLCASAARARRWLDVGTGSGLCALGAAARGTPQVIAADLNPRTPPFVRLGAALSGVPAAVEPIVCDLMSGAPPGRYDVITFNAPLLYGDGNLLWRYSREGDALLARFLGELPDRLGSEALVHCQLPNDERPLWERAPVPMPHTLEALSVRYEVDEGWTQGLLWLAPGPIPRWVEVIEELTPSRMVLDRELLEKMMERYEMASPPAT